MINYWRRDRDSNPGNPRRFAGFQDQSIQPLCHLSVTIGKAFYRLFKISKLTRSFYEFRIFSDCHHGI